MTTKTDITNKSYSSCPWCEIKLSYLGTLAELHLNYLCSARPPDTEYIHLDDGVKLNQEVDNVCKNVLDSEEA